MGNTCCSVFCSSQNETAMDLTTLTEMVQDMNHLDQLISIIEERLEAIFNKTDKGQQNTHAQETASSSWFASYTNIGKDLVEEVSKRAERNRCMACFKSSFNRETRKVVIDVLKEASQIHSLAAGLCVVGYLLDQIEQVSDNRTQSVQLLRYMCAMARRVKQLDNSLPSEKENLNQAVNFIFEGCLVCLRLMKSHRLSRLFCASVDAGDLTNLENQIKHTYPDLILGAVIGVLENMPHFLPPMQGEDVNAVGMREAKDKVISLLKMEPSDESKRAVVLYGVGGVGKTTLATDVFNSLDLKAYKFCRLDMDQNCSNEHVKQLQQQILQDVFGDKIQLRSCAQGQDQLTRAFKKTIRPIFIFIDNALTESDLTKLLPEDLSCLPRGMRMLLTTRRLDQTNVLLSEGIQRFEYRVDFLSKSDSKKLLCKRALGSANASFPEGVESRVVEEIVEMCGGLPLIIVLVGSKLKKCVDDISVVRSVKEFLKESLMEGEGEMSERVVDVVYNSLDENSKQAFLDIVCFFKNKSRRSVGYAVGNVQLQVLVDAALINVSHNLLSKSWEHLTDFKKYMDAQEGIIRVHDVIESRGRKLSKTDRIMELEGLIEAVEDRQKLQNVKGIWISGGGEYELQAKFLDLIHSSLRVLHLGYFIRVNGKCLQRFERLRYLDDSLKNTCSSSMDLDKLERLAVLKGGIANKGAELPASLHSIILRGSSHLPKFGNLTSLEEMDLSKCHVLHRLPESFGQLRSLRFLDLEECSNLSILPDTFGNLSALQALSLYKCSQLASLPPTFGELKSLSFLDLRDCESLTTLPNSFGYLSSLQVLYLEDCSNLVTLPESFGNVSALRRLYLSSCSSLENLPQSFGQLSYLTYLDMDGCKKLSSLPDSFGQLKSLEYLKINLCLHLERFCGDCTGLISLMAVEASFCKRLKGEAMDVLAGAKSLMFFKMYESHKLIRRWKQVREHYALLACCSSYNSDRQMAVQVDLSETIDTVLFHPQSRYLRLDGDRQLVEWSLSRRSTGTDVALLLTMCDLSSTSSSQALQRVNQELQCMMEKSSAPEDFAIIYMEAGDSWGKSEEHIRQRLLLLPGCTLAWMAPDNTTSQIFKYAVYASRKESLNYAEAKLVVSFHTYIVTYSLGMDREGERSVRWIDRYFPDDYASEFDDDEDDEDDAQVDDEWQGIREKNLEALVDPGGGLDGLFHALDGIFLSISNCDFYERFWWDNPDETRSEEAEDGNGGGGTG